MKGKLIKKSDGKIVVEYDAVMNKDHLKSEWKTLPLHPDDYEKALLLIGQEVEFKQSKPPEVFKGIGKELTIYAKL